MLLNVISWQVMTWACYEQRHFDLSNMADTQELQRLALVANLMDRSLSMPDTDDCVADLRRLNRYHVVNLLTK